jgi:hypothetical protein
MEYDSQFVIESKEVEGVRLTIRRMSFGRRIELARQIRDLANRMNFLEAGTDPREKMTAVLLGQELDEIYLRWGLAAVEGLRLDGVPATPDGLLRDGPEELVREALGAIRAQFGLNEEERKN